MLHNGGLKVDGMHSVELTFHTSRLHTTALLVAALVMAVVVLGTCASGANAALRVRNSLNSTLTILHPPGCCPICIPTVPGRPCTEVCEVCADVKVKRRQEVTLDSHVGPYPLEYLQIRVRSLVYCVPATDLYRLNATALLLILPGGDIPGDAWLNSLLGFFIQGVGGVRYMLGILCKALVCTIPHTLVAHGGGS